MSNEITPEELERMEELKHHCMDCLYSVKADSCRRCDLAEYRDAMERLFTVTPIPADLGGGYNAALPELSELAFTGDGETATEAIANLLKCVVEVVQDMEAEIEDLRDRIAKPEKQEEKPDPDKLAAAELLETWCSPHVIADNHFLIARLRGEGHE